MISDKEVGTAPTRPDLSPRTVAQHADLLPWRDQVDWWTDPRLAYAAGLADGYDQAIGPEVGPPRTDDEFRRAVRAVLRMQQHAENRARAAVTT
jgi:hypothetical protein